MKTTLYALILLSLTSCATICGGRCYYAQIMVPNCPDAEISYNGQYVGKSSTEFLIDRRDANKVVLSVSHPSYDTEIFEFHERQFRGWAFAGTILGWTGTTPNGILLPWGLAVDGITGSWWKPSVFESGVTKRDNKHYVYTLDYLKKISDSTQNNMVNDGANGGNDISARLEKLKELYESGLISSEEYESSRKNILKSFEDLSH